MRSTSELSRAADKQGKDEYCRRVKALVLAVVVLVVHARIVLGGSTWDDAAYHVEVAPPRLAAATAVLDGEAPTWWEGSALGVPLLGEPSHGAAYPLAWLAAGPRVLDLLVLAHLFWFALGIALWARRLGATELGALIAGVIAGASGIAIAAGLRGELFALAHVPWVGWAAHGVARAGSVARARREAAALGLLLGAIGLTGSLAIFVDAVVLAAVLGARAGSVRGLVPALAAGIAIACVQWVPAFAIANELTGGDVHALKLSRLLELVVPGSFGATTEPRGVAAIAGDAPYLPGLFIGAPVFALAVVARPGRRLVVVAAVLLGLALVVGRGGGWPHWLGAPELHLAVLAALAAAHAGLGIDTLVEGERRALVAISSAAIVTLLSLAAVAMLRSRAGSPALDRALLDGGLAFACAAGVCVIAWRAGQARWRALALAALLVAPSVGSLGATAPVIERDVVERVPLWAEAARAAIDPTNPRVPLRVYRPISLFEQRDAQLADVIATLASGAPARFGLGAARSEDPARPVAHDRVWLAAAAAGGSLLERYGITLAILPASLVEGRNFGELARRGQWALAKFPAAPAAAMVFEWIWIADDTEAVARLFPAGAGRGLPAGLVVLHGRGPQHQDEPRPAEPCTVNRWARGAIDLTCAAQEPSYAVVSSTAAHGWTVAVDGRETPWVTADVMRRAVAIPGGAHVVSWRYVAPGLTAGIVLAALGIALLIGGLLWPVRREVGPDEN